MIEDIKMKRLIPIIILAIISLTSCKVSNKQIIRQQHLEEGVESPTSVEESTSRKAQNTLSVE